MTDLPLHSLLGVEPPAGWWVRANMAMTLSGSTTIDGLSGGLGNATDHRLFHALRDWADVVFVGAKTVKLEGYGGVQPVKPSVNTQINTQNFARQPATIAVPTRTLDFDITTPFFTECLSPPVFLVPAAALAQPLVAARRDELLAAGARVLAAGHGSMEEYLQTLRALGFARVLCEGGPGVLGQLVQHGSIDQFFLTLSPQLGSSVPTPLTASPAPPVHRRMALEAVHADGDGTVFLRYGHSNITSPATQTA